MFCSKQLLQGKKRSDICCLCHDVLTERGLVCSALEARRMFACRAMRSGTLPTLVRSDRGPELKNGIMLEYSAMIGVGRRFGTPWRPMEQGLVEGKHNETQKIIGILVKDIMQCMPNETGELQYVVEFIVYNTPGPHGYTPRDIDRRWSLSTPLERELQPFQVNEFEPISDYVAKLFKNYREIRVRVLGWMQEKSRKRAELANRFRTSKQIQPGMQVVLRDPRHRKAGGRTPYRQPYTDPCEVLEVHGNKCTIRKPDGSTTENVHMEDVIIVPEGTKSLESKEPLTFAEDDDYIGVREDLNRRRSPGLMVEQREDKKPAPLKPGKLEKIVTGSYIAYKSFNRQAKTCEIGRVLNISRQ